MNMRKEVDARRKKEYCTTFHQRREITRVLRESFDDLRRELPNDDFSLSLDTHDLPHGLTHHNRNYFANGYAEEEFKRLFGILATGAEVDIHDSDDGYVISIGHFGKE